MVERDQSRLDSSPAPLDKQGLDGTGEDRHESEPTRLPPTPISSTSSFLQKEIPTAQNGQPEIGADVNPVAQALRNFVLSPSSLKSRRHASLPTSSIDVGSVLAAHISNPITSPHHTAPGSPTAPAVGHHDKLLKSTYTGELRKLTSSATAGSRQKNTPPLTPRALSHEDGHQEKRSPLSSTIMTADAEKASEKAVDRTNDSARNSEALPTNSLKGKLLVNIREARGLKPCYDPYVVCVFEWNEYISKGPKHDAMDVDHQEVPTTRSRKDAISAVHIRRTDGDMRKPMAIPMKSRQSSNNSEMDNHQARSKSLISDPQWDHEATL